MKRTIWASVTVGLAALMTFGCGNVISSTTGRENDSQVVFTPGQNAANPDKIWAVDKDGKFFYFFSDNPGLISAKITPTGVPAGEKLNAIDCRPRTGVLYGITTTGKVGWIDKNTGAFRQVGAGVVPGQINADIDFNPVVDLIRQEADVQNIVLSPNTGTLVATQTNLSINGQPANAVGCAYTNSNGDTATSTQLFVITGATNRVYLQATPGNGVLTEVGQLPVDTASNVGFDISPSNVGYVASQKLSDNFSNLLRFDPASGGAAIISAIGGTPVKSIAVDMTGPAVTHFAGIDASNKLVTFDSNDPTVLLSSTLITGLQGGDTIVGCDFAPGGDAATGLKVLTVNNTTGRIYNVNLTTGAATLQATVNPPLVDPATNTYGVDIDATGTMEITAAQGTFALGIVSGQSTKSWHVSSTSGAGAADTNLIYPASDRLAVGTPRNTFIPALGFTNNFQGAGNAQLLHGVDVTSSAVLPFDEFVGITPIAGTTASIGEMNLFGTPTCELDVDPAGNIWFCSQRAIAGTGTFDPENFSTLYRVSPQTGGTQTVTRVGGGPLKHFTTIPTFRAAAAPNNMGIAP